MDRKRWLAWLGGVAIAAGAVAGCDRPQNKNAIVLNPTTRQVPAAPKSAHPTTARSNARANATSRPAQTASATQAAKSPKEASWMRVNGVFVEFPEAKLVLRRDGEKITALLCSNDPPEVLHPNYQGNRYYFEMTLDSVDDVKNIHEADFRYRAASAEPQDTPNGIFLDGDRQHFEPYDIEVIFEKDGDKIIADIRGQFLYFQKGNMVGQPIAVMATVSAKPDVK